MKRFTVLLAAVLALSGCAVTEPFDAAETTSQKVFAVTSTYNVVLESARDIVVDESLPLEVRRAVQRAEARTTPIINELEDAFVLYVAESVKFKNAETTEEQLAVVTTNLLTWLDQSELALLELIEAVKGD